MKTILFSLILLCSLTFSFGQNVKIVKKDGTKISGDTVYITGSSSDIQIYKEFDVINTTASPIDVYWARTVQNISDPSFIVQLCDDIVCHNADKGKFWVSSVYNLKDTSIFKPQLRIGAIAGTAEVTYYVLDAAKNKIDSLHVFFTATAGINDNEQLQFDMYPNPATDYISISGKNNLNGKTVVIMDALGKIVKQVKLKATQTSIIVNDLKEGIYFVRVESPSSSNVRKLVVR